jgi:hypothetical protein
VWPRTIIADLRRHGRNIDRILDEAGLNQRRVNREGGRIPWQAQAKLMDIGARELADDCYGIHLAAKVDVRDADALAYIGLASHTLGDALANIARYSQTFKFDVSTEDGLTVVTTSGWNPSFRPPAPADGVYRRSAGSSLSPADEAADCPGERAFRPRPSARPARGVTLFWL